MVPSAEFWQVLLFLGLGAVAEDLIHAKIRVRAVAQPDRR